MASESGQAKYSIVYENLKKEIISGNIKPGDKIPSENELSTQYGVSRHTVRKAISILQHAGFIQTEQGLGSFCSSTLVNRTKSHNIAVVTTYISDYIFPRLISGIDHVLTQHGYSIILKNTGNSQENEKKVLEEILAKDIDGIIIEPSKSEILCMHEKQYKVLEEWNIPYIFIQGVYPQMHHKPHIILDDTYGAYLATKHLIDLGHENIVGIFKVDDMQGMARLKGYSKALAEANRMYDPDRVILFHTEDRMEKPAMLIRQWLAQNVEFDGVVCYNDEIALEIYNVLAQCGKRVPQDISITGFDQSGIAMNGPIRFTTVSHPKEQLGEMAASLLLEKLGKVPDEESKIPRMIRPELILGESSIKRIKE